MAGRSYPWWCVTTKLGWSEIRRLEILAGRLRGSRDNERPLVSSLRMNGDDREFATGGAIGRATSL